MSGWSPERYLKFEEERTRPARDLLARVPLGSARSVYDLGCGPGNSTRLLVERFGAETVTGVDSDPAMLAAARKALPHVRFVEADIASWAPEEPADLIYANASFQWLADPLAAMARMLDCLAPGGALAVQMPDNLAEPSHRLMEHAAISGPWADRFAKKPAQRHAVPGAGAVYDRLAGLSRELDIWHTIYNHRLAGPRGIIDWFASTGLRPYLDGLEGDERDAFLADYERRIAAAYPARTDGTVLLRFPRLFIVAVKR